MELQIHTHTISIAVFS